MTGEHRKNFLCAHWTTAALKVELNDLWSGTKCHKNSFINDTFLSLTLLCAAKIASFVTTLNGEPMNGRLNL